MRTDDHTLLYPKFIARKVGLCANEINALKLQGCPFYGRKTCVAWVRAYLAELSGASIPPEKAVQVTTLINLWMGRIFPLAVILGVVVAVVNIFRIVRVAAPTAHVPGETAAMA